MALVGIGQVPEDGQRITKAEAIKLQWEMIQEWKPRKDVFSLIYGPGILGVMSAVSGFMLNHHYRKKLKLGSYGHLSSYFPLVIMPAALSAFFHRTIVSTSIVIGETKCVICTEVGAVALQTGLGVLYPLVMAPSACYMLANRYNTVKVPNIITHGKKAYWDFHMVTSRSFYRKVPYIILVQAVCAAVVTYFDFKNYFCLNNKIIEIEKKMTADGEHANMML